MGPDTKANTRELVRAPGGLLERLQRRVALEALGESDSSFGTEAVLLQTASTGEEASSEECQGALTERRTLWGGGGLERGHSAPLERLAQLVDTLGGVGAVSVFVEAAELVVSQAAKGRRSVNGR